MSIGKRLRQAIIYNRMNLKEFSKNSQIPYRTLQEYLTDSRMPGAESLIKIDAELSININWLLTGKGEIYREEKADEKIAKPESELFLTWLKKWWENADDKHRHWMEVQMKRCFPEYTEWLAQQGQSQQEKSGG